MDVRDRGKPGLNDVMTVAEVADYLHLNKLTVYKYIREGKLQAIRFGRTFRVLREDIHMFLEAQRTVRGQHQIRPSRTTPRVSQTAPQPPENGANERVEEYLDPRRDIVQPRETMLTDNPLDWVLRGLH